MKNLKFIIFILFFLGHKNLIVSQQENKYIHNFSPVDYKASDQNWSSIQDKHGFIYFANLNGVLVYDGKIWKTIRLPNVCNVFSLDINHNNEVFVGGDNEFGVLLKKDNGAMIYKSLSETLKKEEKDFTNIWATYCIGDDVFFCSNEKIFKYSNHKIKTYLPEKKGFHTFFKLNNHLFVREFEVGFKVFENNQLRFVLGSEIFSNLKVYSILQKKESSFIVASRNGGLFNLLYDNEHPSHSVFSKIDSEIDKWLFDNELYCGQKIDNNHYAFGSLKNGIILVDNKYKCVSKINTSNGLQDDAVKHITKDANGNLWLCLNNGISYFENNTPITFWKKQDGVNGTVECAIKFKNELFISTDKGLKKYDEKLNLFVNTTINSPCYLLSKSGNELYITSEEGTFSYNGKSFKLLDEEVSYSCAFNNETKQLCIGTDNGLLLIDDKLNVVKRFDNLGAIRSIAFDKNNNIGLGTSKNGIYIIKKNYSITNITEKDGLPSLSETNIFQLKGEFIFCTDNGFYNYYSNKAIKSPILNIGKSFSVVNAFNFKNEIWFQSNRGDEIKEKIDEINVISIVNGKCNLTQSPLNRIQNSSIKHFLFDTNYVYISSNQGLYRYELNKYRVPEKFNVVLSRIRFKSDSVNFLENFTSNITSNSIEIDYSKNEFIVFPTATSFYETDKMQFSYYLEGKETTFKNWNVVSKIEYNNLFENDYKLHIKAKDIFGNITPELVFEFTINPPWYRTFLAYILYGLALITIVLIIIKLYTFRLIQRNVVLEETINLRTKTIVDQKHELEHKNKEIVDSINYAQRIQKSLLASDQLLKKNLKNYFVFFQPKDIVSGDFYWGAEFSDNRFALVTADSTGHGVPGAIMSMLNISCLNEAIEAQKLNQPKDILNFTRTKVIKYLSNDGSETGGKDGMDCSLICFDLENKKITYSAANNPIWIVRNGQLIELKPDKMPIGKHDRDSESFNQHEFELHINDVVYALTDGMPDQFGGPKGKKFMYKQLKELLVSISNLPMNQQKQKLFSCFVDWKIDLEQVDDVLIIGVRV